MKISVRLLLVAVLMFVMSLGVAQAQDSGDALPADTDGYLVMVADSGTVSANDDDTVSITLNDVAPVVPLVLTAPEVVTGNYDTQFLADDWVNAAELSATATLRFQVVSTQPDEIADWVVTLMLMPGSYDSANGTFTFNATVESVSYNVITGVTGSQESEFVEDASKDFTDNIVGGDAITGLSLLIDANAEFLDGLVAGRVARFTTARPTTTTGCIPNVTCTPR